MMTARGIRKIDDLQAALDLSRGVLESPAVVDGALVVRVGGIGLEGEDDGVRRDEARDVVHVPVRVVTDAPFAEPDRACRMPR